MKVINLNDILNIINVHNKKEVDCQIEYVGCDIKKIGNKTLIFHLNKEVELNLEQFKKLEQCFIITDQPLLNGMDVNSERIIYVSNIHRAYQNFIDYYRQLFEIPVVAITGTCGKTTTKEMISQVLKNKYQVVSTISNKNALGYDHDYLMSIDDETDFGIFETAISYPGDLIYGCEYFKPTIGVITTIGIDHLNGCKTLDNYIRTKGEMLAGLQYKGQLIINNDDENIKKINLASYQGQIITFGLSQDSDFSGLNIQYGDKGMTFTLRYNQKSYEVYVPGYGEHNVYNALAALATLTLLGMDLSESISYIAKMKHIRSHLEVHHGVNKSTIIDDTWSSNPTSMEAAFKVLNELGKDKTRIAVLGKISYLGEFANQYYEQIAKQLIDYKIDFLITQDSHANHIGKVATKLGMDPNYIIHCKDQDEVKSTLEFLLDENTMVLFKISMLDQTLTNVMKQLIIDE